VSVYKPDSALPPKLTGAVKARLYQNGLKMREISLANPRFVTKALEVSQNPKEPCIVTEYAKHDLDELISNGIMLKPKRMYAILSQILEAIINSTENGWIIGHIHPRQVKLQNLDVGDISFSVIEGIEDDAITGLGGNTHAEAESTNMPTMPLEMADSSPSRNLFEQNEPSQTADQDQSSKSLSEADTIPDNHEATVAIGEHATTKDAEKQLWVVQRNIYTLGNIIYQLLFGRKYEPNDDVALANIKKLAGRWRKILEKTLSEDIERRYSTYEGMLKDVRKSTSRNRRMAVASTPFLLILVVIAGYIGYEKYREHKIMTSDTGK